MVGSLRGRRLACMRHGSAHGTDGLILRPAHIKHCRCVWFISHTEPQHVAEPWRTTYCLSSAKHRQRTPSGQITLASTRHIHGYTLRRECAAQQTSGATATGAQVQSQDIAYRRRYHGPSPCPTAACVPHSRAHRSCACVRLEPTAETVRLLPASGALQRCKHDRSTPSWVNGQRLRSTLPPRTRPPPRILCRARAQLSARQRCRTGLPAYAPFELVPYRGSPHFAFLTRSFSVTYSSTCRFPSWPASFSWTIHQKIDSL